jgi:DNA recombination protein RmuC
MQTLMISMAVILMVVILALLIWLINNQMAARREFSGQGAGLALLQQQLEAVRTAQEKTSTGLHQSLQTGQDRLFGSLKQSHDVMARLNSQIGRLQGASQQMVALGSDVRKLQDILASPKLRGQMGEWSLETLLSTVLPKEAFELQHTLKDGKIVDALVQLRDFSVPIDAKFPLPSFVRLHDTDEDKQRSRLRRQFHKDVTVHVDKIAASYIRPTEGTLDFALMYIPAENVYYEIVVKQPTDTVDLLQYCLDRKVIPVSPNLLYVYLMTVAMGLHGMQIEQQAAQIRQDLKSLTGQLAAFEGSWDTLGSHLRNANSKYEEAHKRLDHFSLHLSQIHGADAAQS